MEIELGRVFYTFCDACNPDWDPGNDFIPPDEWAEKLGIPPGTPIGRGVVQGRWPIAQKQGWEEMDYGHRCPVCAYEEGERGEGQVLSEEGALDLLLGRL